MKKEENLNFKRILLWSGGIMKRIISYVNKQEHIRIINNRIGLSTPYIITPLQIFPIKEGKEDV